MSCTAIIAHDGSPESLIDAEIGTLCRNLSGPEIWKKTTGWSTLTGWEEIGSGGGGDATNYEVATGNLTVSSTNHGRVFINDAGTAKTLTFPTVVSAGFEFESQGIWNYTEGSSTFAQFVSGSLISGTTLNNAAQPYDFARFRYLGANGWIITNASFTVVVEV